MELTGQLKLHTADLHNEAEELLYAAAIMDRTLTMDQLVHLLRIHHRFHRMLEQWIAPHEAELKAMGIWPLKRSTILKSDLHACGASEQGPYATDGGIDLQRTLGVLYVSEGSMLGGAMIAKALSTHPDLQHLPLGFFKAYGQDLRQHWITLCGRLNDRPASEWPRILGGATMAFEAYKECHAAVPFPERTPR